MIRRALGSAFAAVCASACGAAQADADYESDMTAPFVCDLPTTIEAARAATASDSLEVVEHAYLALPDGGSSFPAKSVTTAGTPCSTASDRAACLAQLDALRTSTQGSITMCLTTGCGRYGFYLVTKGDAVTAVATREDLVRLFAPIDTEAEATLLLFSQGYSTVDCHGAQGWIRRAGADFEVRTQDSNCGTETRTLVRVTSEGVVTRTARESKNTGDACVGRRPVGLVLGEPDGSTAVARWLANVAALEASSITAFRDLRAHLHAYGAPPELLARCERAALDETRHTRQMTRLARRRGAEPSVPVVPRRALPSLLELAIENAVEGCVRETFGALSGMWQARTAGDPDVRRAMKTIAIDEVRHAELAWEVAEWLDQQLLPAERALVRDARAEAVRELARDAADPVTDDVVVHAGVPSPSVSVAMVRELASRAWN